MEVRYSRLCLYHTYRCWPPHEQVKSPQKTCRTRADRRVRWGYTTSHPIHPLQSQTPHSIPKTTQSNIFLTPNKTQPAQARSQIRRLSGTRLRPPSQSNAKTKKAPVRNRSEPCPVPSQHHNAVMPIPIRSRRCRCIAPPASATANPPMPAPSHRKQTGASQGFHSGIRAVERCFALHCGRCNRLILEAWTSKATHGTAVPCRPGAEDVEIRGFSGVLGCEGVGDLVRSQMMAWQRLESKNRRSSCPDVGVAKLERRGWPPTPRREEKFVLNLSFVYI